MYQIDGGSLYHHTLFCLFSLQEMGLELLVTSVAVILVSDVCGSSVSSPRVFCVLGTDEL